MNPRLDNLIAEFRTAQDIVVNALIEQLGLPRPKSNREWCLISIERGLAQRTSVDGIEFNAHGFGVYVTVGDVTCDFDWGEHGEGDGFDAWRLFIFALQKVEELKISHEEIIAWLQESWDQGELVFDGSLFYDPRRRTR